MPTLLDLAQKYSINANKPHFPVNSLRLLYFIIIDHYTQGNQDAFALMSAVIPKIDQVFAARIEEHRSGRAPSIEDDLRVTLEPLNGLFGLINTQVVHSIFHQLQTSLLPMQDELFGLLYQDLQSDRPLTPIHLRTLFRARTIDSIIFSTILAEIVAKYWRQEQHPSTSLTSIHYHVNFAYRLNDLIDTIVFAEEDMKSNSFSPFTFISKIAPEPAAAKEVIRDLLSYFQSQWSYCPFPSDLQRSVVQFYEELTKVIQP